MHFQWQNQMYYKWGKQQWSWGEGVDIHRIHSPLFFLPVKSMSNFLFLWVSITNQPCLIKMMGRPRSEGEERGCKMTATEPMSLLTKLTKMLSNKTCKLKYLNFRDPLRCTSVCLSLRIKLSARTDRMVKAYTDPIYSVFKQVQMIHRNLHPAYSRLHIAHF